MRVTNRSGFTLVELLIVVVVIGILATIAIPKFSAMREKSYVAAVTSDLKNLASQQEIYLSNYYTYTTAIADLDLLLTSQVSISIAEATGQGWAATGTHTGTVRPTVRDVLRQRESGRRGAGHHPRQRRVQLTPIPAIRFSPPASPPASARHAPGSHSR